jgi:molecular chaperone HtpG
MAAQTNEKKVSRSNYISDDIAFSILSKLPVKSLKRFSCVRKSWSILFVNPNFINMFRDNLISKPNPLYDDACLILNQFASLDFNYNLYLFPGDSFEKKVKMEFPPPIDFHHGDFIGILGSAINGTLCIYDRENNTKVVLWNPATNEIKVIPPSLGEVSPKFMTACDLNGFGYDHITDDYKVIQHVCYVSFTLSECPWDDVTPKSFWEIYSLKSNSWKKLDFDMPTRDLRTNTEVYLNGACHWMFRASGVTYVVSFYLCNEVVFITPLPLEDVHNDHLVVLNGCIAIIYNYKENISFQISMLGEVGVKESWIRLFNIAPFSYIDYPIGTGKKGNIFFRNKNDELTCFDLTTGLIEEIGVKGEFLCQMIIYKENLHPIGGINN